MIPQTIEIPENRLAHIFRNAPGHLSDTPSNRKLLKAVANDRLTRLGEDQFGNIWHARTNPDGTQVWVQVRGEKIINGGINHTPRSFHAKLGLSTPDFPS